MAKPNIDMDRIAHGAAPSVLTEFRQAINDFRRSPNLVIHCAIIVAFVCLAVGAALLKWGLSDGSEIIIGSALAFFMLSFVIWAAIAVAALWMLRGLVSYVVGEMRRNNP